MRMSELASAGLFVSLNLYSAKGTSFNNCCRSVSWTCFFRAMTSLGVKALLSNDLSELRSVNLPLSKEIELLLAKLMSQGLSTSSKQFGLKFTSPISRGLSDSLNSLSWLKSLFLDILAPDAGSESEYVRKLDYRDYLTISLWAYTTFWS